MANKSLSNAAAIDACDAVVDRVDLGATDAQGDIKIYDGTIPADADTALSGNTLLAELQMSNPAFSGAVDANPGGQATANSISDDISADATGTASFFRMNDRNNVTVLQGDVTAIGGGGDMELGSTSITAGDTISLSSMTVTMPES